MLTKLRFKNWRSLRDVEIELTPITVFIGANASGKSNILDALHFLHYALEYGVKEATFLWGYEKIHRVGISLEENIELGFSLHDEENPKFHRRYQYKLILKQVSEPSPPHLLHGEVIEEFIAGKGTRGWGTGDLDSLELDTAVVDVPLEVSDAVRQFPINRWQLLDEDFMPPMSAPAGEIVDLYRIDRKARNVPYMLDFMKKFNPILFKELEEDFQFLLGYVDKLEPTSDERETRLQVREKPLGNEIAPKVSGGTARILAMLTAIYTLNMKNPELPSLVAIEEPDTAINPDLLDKLVELMRYHIDEEHPRQFILTTHNPHFLNFFKPEEVRIVERDENGITTVKPVPMDVYEIWQEKKHYSLGEIWVTRTLGGVPE